MHDKRSPNQKNGAAMQVFDLKGFLTQRKQIVDKALEECLPPVSGLEKSVIEAARYSLFAGGKRLRPILCMQAAEVVGASYEAVMQVACAMEMIHTYSLIHDDLPAMDNDDFRRGMPTNHKVFGEAVAILAGDALLTEAFELVARMHDNASISAEKIIRAIRIMTKAAGYRGMIGGQIIDLECENLEVDIATVEYMHIHKTGAMLSACLELGALLGGGSEAEIAALTKYGQHFGLAFQITDDLLDVEGDVALMGKTPGSDRAKNKKTYPAILGIAKSRESARLHVEEALRAISSFSESAEPLRAIARYLLVRQA
jgi:geranylgeranyl diphosphate synthase, type II